MKRLLTAAIAVAAIATFVSPGERPLSNHRRDLYVAALQRSMVCRMQERPRYRISRSALDWCLYKPR
ncbi:MAG: hypothetical protein ACFB4J_12255 [Elainellaceae cyanobacterium]